MYNLRVTSTLYANLKTLKIYVCKNILSNHRLKCYKLAHLNENYLIAILHQILKICTDFALLFLNPRWRKTPILP